MVLTISVRTPTVLHDDDGQIVLVLVLYTYLDISSTLDFLAVGATRSQHIIGHRNAAPGSTLSTRSTRTPASFKFEFQPVDRLSGSVMSFQ